MSQPPTYITSGVNYGDLVVIADTILGGLFTNPTTIWGWSRIAGNASVFQVLSNQPNNQIPLDPTTQLPMPVNFGQTVIFATPTAAPSLISYGSSSLKVTNLPNGFTGYVPASTDSWTLAPVAQQSVGQLQAFNWSNYSQNPLVPPANSFYATSLYKNTASMSDLKQFWETEDIGKGASPLQLWLYSPFCTYNADCGNTPNNVCYQGTSPSNPLVANGKCYNFPNLSSSLAQTMIGSTCQANLGNNLIGQACLTYCNAQNTNVPANSTVATACDQQMTSWCNAQYPGTGPGSVPGPGLDGTPNWCTCLKAQQQQTPGPNTAPQCFYPGCAGCPSGTYCTSSMLQQFNPASCSGACSVIVNCAGAGTCQVDNNKFCFNCPSTQVPAGSSLNCGSPPTWISTHWKEVAIATAAVILALMLIIAVLSTNRGGKK